MLLRGAKHKVISEALGHASVAFTMDTYSHIIESMQSDAMALLAEVMPQGINSTFQKNNLVVHLDTEDARIVVGELTRLGYESRVVNR